jgi:hypothetical protein
MRPAVRAGLRDILVITGRGKRSREDLGPAFRAFLSDLVQRKKLV